MFMNKNFAIIGCAGFVAPRHLKAIKDTDNNLVVALDKNDSVGILDKYFDNVDFFTEFERFDRYIEKLKREADNKIDFVTICSPNYLHDPHIRFALRAGADVICEKPLVINNKNLDDIEKLEKETGKKVYNVLQLRLHPTIKYLKKKVDEEFNGKKYEVDLSYITWRGNWYNYSWKGNITKSGGLAVNLGIHFFDMLIWIFGAVKKYELYYSDKDVISGYFELEKANVKWFLSTRKKDLSNKFIEKGKNAYRSIIINGMEFEFSDGFADLHTEVYKDIFNGGGFGIRDARPSIELCYILRNCEVKKLSEINKDNIHPDFNRIFSLNK